MILPAQAIKRLSQRIHNNGSGLIHPFNESNLRPSSYDLTVGEEYYLGQNGKSSTLSTQRLKSHQSFTIPPHAVCFVLATEAICLPADLTAKVSLRMTHIYAGMVLTSQPPFDPHYHGGIVIMLHNLSSVPFHLKRGERVATIEFVRLEEASHYSKAHRSVRTLEEQLPKPLVSSLTEIADMSTSTRKRVSLLSRQLLGFVAVIIAVLAIPNVLSYSYLQERISEQKSQLKEMEQTMNGYKRELDQNMRATEELKNRLVVMPQKPVVLEAHAPSPEDDAGSGRP